MRRLSRHALARSPVSERVSTATLAAMREYYRARAAEYDEWFYRQGRFDRSPETNAQWFAESATVFAALDEQPLTGDVVELAPGTGIWTERLVRTATSVTAIDAAPEMIAFNRAKVASERVTYQQADLFAWQPEREYDGAFCGFWLSHVPLARLDQFLQVIASALRPGGRFFFVDSRREPTGTSADHELPAPGSETMTRRLNDGREFEIVKNFYEPDVLAARFHAAGLDMVVRETPNYFIYGAGQKLPAPPL